MAGGLRMTGKFHADTILADRVARSGPLRLEITLGGQGGNQLALSLTPEVAAAVARLAGEFAHHAEPGRPALTKMPSEFAIGSGVHDPVVLVRFENDTPYGLSAETAMALGQALIDEAEQMATQPQPGRH
jgi:hypothetical protein